MISPTVSSGVGCTTLALRVVAPVKPVTRVDIEEKNIVYTVDIRST